MDFGYEIYRRENPNFYHLDIGDVRTYVCMGIRVYVCVLEGW